MTGDAVVSEARAELFRIVAAMRVPRAEDAHGPKLQPILGRVKYIHAWSASPTAKSRALSQVNESH
jgi:hypothetical protein